MGYFKYGELNSGASVKVVATYDRGYTYFSMVPKQLWGRLRTGIDQDLHTPLRHLSPPR